jgi:DNA-binding FadR family transcriptional regulator
MDVTLQQSNALLQQFREWLAVATLPSDGRLPPERKLAQQFGVNRAELRKAYAVLEAEGHLWRHVGKGTFVTNPAARGRSHIDDIADHTSPFEAMQARRIIEPELARLAALNATRGQIAEMRSLADKMRAARNWSEYEESDVRFHAKIAEASGNGLMAELHAILNGVRRAVVWGKLDIRPEGPSPDYHSFAEHDSIVDAIANRDRQGAAEAMDRHLNGILSTMADDRR